MGRAKVGDGKKRRPALPPISWEPQGPDCPRSFGRIRKKLRGGQNENGFLKKSGKDREEKSFPGEKGENLGGEKIEKSPWGRRFSKKSQIKKEQTG